MAGVVDAGEGEAAGLFGLAVDDGVRGRDVDVAGRGGAGDVDGVVDGFAAEPVAWVGLLDWDGRMERGGEQTVVVGVAVYHCELLRGEF